MGEENLQIIESYSQGGGNTNTITTGGTQTGNVEKIQSIPRRKAVTRPMRIILICKEMIAYERIAMMQLSSCLKKDGHEVRAAVMLSLIHI